MQIPRSLRHLAQAAKEHLQLNSKKTNIPHTASRHGTRRSASLDVSEDADGNRGHHVAPPRGPPRRCGFG